MTKLFCMLLCTGPLAAQKGWELPTMVYWPLVDIAVTRDTGQSVALWVTPVPRASIKRSVIQTSAFRIRTDSLLNWSASARRLLDTIASGPNVSSGSPRGIKLTASPKLSFLNLAFETRLGTAPRFFLQFGDTLGLEIFSAVGYRRDAEMFLQAVEQVASLPARVLPEQIRGKVVCEGRVPPKVKKPKPLEMALNGLVVLEFIIDTNGVPLDSTVRVLQTSGPSYTAAVRKYFQNLRFEPGKCPSGKVEYFVQQSFLGN